MTTMDKVGQNLEYISVDALIPYARNSRTHSDAQVAQIAASIREFGFTNPVLIDDQGGIIAGHGRTMAARKLKINEIPCLRLSHLTDAQKKAYIIADNKLALNAGWDESMLKIEIDELKNINFDISLLGFDDLELKELFEENEDESENEYTQKVDSPTYEPSEVKPDIKELFDDSKAFNLIEKIKSANLPQAEKDFLMLTAGRHVVLNFQMIADYYAHSDEQMQSLMEDSALVIVDFNDAISNGWVNLSEKLDAMYDEENGEADDEA